jgi:hypothetical protein
MSARRRRSSGRSCRQNRSASTASAPAAPATFTACYSPARVRKGCNSTRAFGRSEFDLPPQDIRF